MISDMAMDKPTPRDDQQCPNCSAELEGPYCASCGQRQVDLDQPFRDLAGEAMESFLSFDTRIARTLWPLIRRPGLLTVEFMAGRRARYVHPFKLYFAFSVLLFLGLAISDYSVIHVGETEDVVTGFRVQFNEGEGVEEATEVTMNHRLSDELSDRLPSLPRTIRTVSTGSSPTGSRNRSFSWSRSSRCCSPRCIAVDGTWPISSSLSTFTASHFWPWSSDWRSTSPYMRQSNRDLATVLPSS